MQWEAYLALAFNLIVRIRCIPPGNQFIGSLAKVFTVDDCACEYTRDIKTVGQCGVGRVLDIECTIEGDIGCPGSHIKLDFFYPRSKRG
jgi:hypothetical protein